MRAIGLLALLHLYVGWRVAPDLPWPTSGGAFLLLLGLNAMLVPAAFASRRLPDREVADRWTWAGMLALGLFSMLLVLTVLRDAVLLATLPFLHGGLAQATAPAVPLLALAAIAWGLFEARRTACVREVDVPIAGLPPALQGFTIVQISDVHVGPTVKRPYVQAIVDAVNRLNADAIAAVGAGGGRCGLRPAIVRPHSRRPVLAMEPFRATAAAVHGRPAPVAASLGLHQPRHWILGPSPAPGCSVGDHSGSSGGGRRFLHEQPTTR